MAPSIRLENKYKNLGYSNIAGLDEAGKGAWAGPVVAAAVILPEKIKLPSLNDSKLLTPKKRDNLYDEIINGCIAYGVGIRDAFSVDEIGLAEAHRQAMREAVKNLKMEVDLLLVDGLGIKQLGIKTECIVKGDQKVRCISAASIIAKVTRDRMMAEFNDNHPNYGFQNHKGYGTKEHEQAIELYGPCELHRLSYSPVYRAWQKTLF